MDWNARQTYNFPTRIRFGKGVIDELADHLKEQGLSRPLIVTDGPLSELVFFKNVLAQLAAKNISSVLFTEIDKNPVKKNVMAGKETYHQENADCVIGFGGGASMDVARAVALAAYHDRDLFDFDDALGGDKHATEKIPYFICVPTTSGTGSEVGRSSVISEDETHRKRILFSPRLLAPIVFADPELTMELPPGITAATGMDALTHNVEAYVAKGFHPLCDGIALEGVKLISDALPDAVKKPSIENRSKMMIASLMGATAFQKGLGVVHSCAHPLSTKFDTHHGLANAVMLPYGIEFNSSEVQAKYDALAGLVGVKDFKAWVENLNQEIGIPSSLKELNIGREHLDELCDLAVKDPCHPNNPKACSRQDFKNIYIKAMK